MIRVGLTFWWFKVVNSERWAGFVPAFDDGQPIFHGLNSNNAEGMIRCIKNLTTKLR